VAVILQEDWAEEGSLDNRIRPLVVWELGVVGSSVVSSSNSKALEEGAFLVPSRRPAGASLATHPGRTKVLVALEVDLGQGEASLVSSRQAKVEDCLGTLQEEDCSVRQANRLASGDLGDRRRWVKNEI